MVNAVEEVVTVNAVGVVKAVEEVVKVNAVEKGVEIEVMAVVVKKLAILVETGSYYH